MDDLFFAAHYLISLVIPFNDRLITNVYGFQYITFLVFIQLLFIIFGFILLKIFRFIEFPSFRFSDAIQRVPFAICNAIATVTLMLAIKDMSIPMISIFRRFTIIPNWIVRAIITRNEGPPLRRVATMFVMLIGAIIAAGSDLTFNSTGFYWIMMYYITATVRIVFSEIYRYGGISNMNFTTSTYYNSIIGLPFIILWMWLQNEFDDLMKYENKSWQFQFSFLFSSIAPFLNFLPNVVHYGSHNPFNINMFSNIKIFTIIFGGLLVFNDVIISFWYIVGIVISFIAITID